MNPYRKILQPALTSKDEGAFLGKEDAQTLYDYIISLEKDRFWLNCLNAAGVDNWEGYDHAIELSNSDD